MYILCMPRPELSEEALNALNSAVQPYFRVDPTTLGTEEKLRVLLEEHHSLIQDYQSLQQQTEQRQQEPANDTLGEVREQFDLS